MIIENISNLAFLIVLIILGIANASYLVFSSYKKKSIVCPIDSNCNEVVRSKWSRVFYVRNDLLGLLFYSLMLLVITFTIINPIYDNTIHFLILIAASLALLFSIFLTGIQLFVFRKRCFYCLASALINLLIFLIVVFNY